MFEGLVVQLQGEGDALQQSPLPCRRKDTELFRQLLRFREGCGGHQNPFENVHAGFLRHSEGVVAAEGQGGICVGVREVLQGEAGRAAQPEERPQDDEGCVSYCGGRSAYSGR